MSSFFTDARSQYERAVLAANTDRSLTWLSRVIPKSLLAMDINSSLVRGVILASPFLILIVSNGFVVSLSFLIANTKMLFAFVRYDTKVESVAEKLLCRHYSQLL